jgi:hypothetical protein
LFIVLWNKSKEKKYTTPSEQFRTIVEKHAKSKPYGIN